MTIDNITKIVIGSIKMIQKISGDEYNDLNLDSIPKDNLMGFDSLREVETTIIIQQTLSEQLRNEVSLNNNVFYSEKKEALSIKEIIDKIDNKIN